MASSERNQVRQSLGKFLGLTERKPAHEIGETSASAAAASVVAVCVENDSEPAVDMALNRLVFQGDELKLIHVRRPIVAVPTPLGNYMPIAQVSSEIVAAHVQKVASQTLDMLRHFQQMCNSKKVQAENVVLEDHNIPKAILKYISNSRVNKLVMMSTHPLIRRKLRGGDMPESDAMKASKFCSIYVVSKGKLAPSKSKLAPVQPGNISPQTRRSCSLRSTLLSSEMTGKRDLKPNETSTNDENGNQRIVNSRRGFEENGNQSFETNQSTENSSKDSEKNGNRSFENNQSTENISEDSEENGIQSFENNQSTENRSKESEDNGNQSTESSIKDSEENGNQSFENNQSTENSRKDSEENGNQSFENSQGTENSSKNSEESLYQSFENSSREFEENLHQSFENNQRTENISKDSEENANQSLRNNQSIENSSKDSEENGNKSFENNQTTENSSKDSEENGNQSFENNQSIENSTKNSEENGNQSFENNQSIENSSKDSEENRNRSFENNQSIENSNREFEENSNQSFENSRTDFEKIGNQSLKNSIRDFKGPSVSKPNIGSKLERLKSDLLQHTSETYREALAFEEAVAAKLKAKGRNVQLIDELWNLEKTKDSERRNVQLIDQLSKLNKAKDSFKGFRRSKCPTA